MTEDRPAIRDKSINQMAPDEPGTASRYEHPRMAQSGVSLCNGSDSSAADSSWLYEPP